MKNSNKFSKLAFASISLTVVTLCSVGITACDKVNETVSEKINNAKGSNSTNSGEVLTVMAGSELKDIEPFLADIKQQTGVSLQLEYSGTLEGVDSILAGKAVDTAWFSHGKYLTLAGSGSSVDTVIKQTSIMMSPVIMGVKQSKAEALGWLNDDNTVKSDITWQTIADASQSGKLKYAMTNPSASNSGFTALMGVTSALAGTSDAPTAEDVIKAKPKLKQFFHGQALTSGSSGWLAEAFITEQNKAGNELDAIINYESVLMQMNQSGKLQDKLKLIYPKEGIVTADYPFSLINPDKKASYDKVVAYLKSEEMQQKLMNQTNRRSVNSKVALDSKFYQGLLIELPFPNSQSIVDGILMDFANELRNPAYALFLLDVSGSMEGQGITQLKQAMLGLTGQSSGQQKTDSSTKFAQFAHHEMVVLKPFSNVTYEAHVFNISDTALPKLRKDIESLNPRGGTAIYSALDDGYSWINSVQKSNVGNTEKPYYYTIVLMTDGQSQDGLSFNEFKTQYEALPKDAKNIKVFTVLFGNADEGEMRQIAELTGGKVFDGRKGNLTQVFRKIRGYQ